MKRLHVLLPATAALIALACPVAEAQWAWQWRDDKGHMVYSDAAPPPSVPPSRIIRNPNSRTATAYEALSAPASGVKAADSNPAAKPGQPASGVNVEIVPGGIRYRDKLNDSKTTTDESGTFSVTWPGPGYYWMSASVRDDKSKIKNAQRRSSYAVTLEVLPQ